MFSFFQKSWNLDHSWKSECKAGNEEGNKSKETTSYISKVEEKD